MSRRLLDLSGMSFPLFLSRRADALDWINRLRERPEAQARNCEIENKFMRLDNGPGKGGKTVISPLQMSSEEVCFLETPNVGRKSARRNGESLTLTGRYVKP